MTLHAPHGCGSAVSTAVHAAMRAAVCAASQGLSALTTSTAFPAVGLTSAPVMLVSPCTRGSSAAYAPMVLNARCTAAPGCVRKLATLRSFLTGGTAAALVATLRADVDAADDGAREPTPATLRTVLRSCCVLSITGSSRASDAALASWTRAASRAADARAADAAVDAFRLLARHGDKPCPGILWRSAILPARHQKRLKCHQVLGRTVSNRSSNS